MMICRKTLEICTSEGMCRPHGGCTPEQPVNQGWKCPVCGKGNAPFAALCANPTCGVDFVPPGSLGNLKPFKKPTS